jgi:hypothetical protein
MNETDKKMTHGTKETAASYVAPTLALPPELGAFLTELTENADLETALRRVLADYVQLKLEALTAQILHFEDKWGMSFEMFANRCSSGTLGQDAYAYDVERDYWAWEEAITLRQHYADLEVPW